MQQRMEVHPIFKMKNKKAEKKKHEAGQGPSQKTAKASWLSADLMAVGLGARRI